MFSEFALGAKYMRLKLQNLKRCAINKAQEMMIQKSIDNQSGAK